MREGWRIRKLGDLADLQRGLTYSKGDEVPFSSKRVLRSNNIDLESSKLDLTELKYLRDDFAIPDDRKVKKNSIFICMSNGSKQHVGKVAFMDTDIDYAFGGFMGLIVPKAGIVPKYVFYSCQSSAYRLFLSSIGNGIGITNLRFTDLANYSLPVPPIAEQEKIVSELDCLTGIIEKKKQQLEELDKLAQSIFYDLFGDPITNEKGWGTRAIQEVAPQTAYKGNIPSHNEKYWLLNLDMVEAQTGTIIDEVLFDEKEIGGSTTTFNEEMVLYSKLRPYLNKVVLPMKPGYGTSELVPLLPDKSILNRVFLACLLRSHSFVAYINLKVAGAKMPRVSLDVFRRFPVILPPLALQNEFAQKIEAVEKQKELVKRSIVETETLFNSRMDFWFNN